MANESLEFNDAGVSTVLATSCLEAIKKLNCFDRVLRGATSKEVRTTSGTT
jgi:hypothetical protein